MPFISSFDVISVVVLLCEAEDERWCPDPKIFLCIPASSADAVADYPKGIKILLANGLIAFFIRVNPVLSNRPRILPRNPAVCIIFNIWDFDNLILADK